MRKNLTILFHKKIKDDAKFKKTDFSSDLDFEEYIKSLEYSIHEMNDYHYLIDDDDDFCDYIYNEKNDNIKKSGTYYVDDKGKVILSKKYTFSDIQNMIIKLTTFYQTSGFNSWECRELIKFVNNILLIWTFDERTCDYVCFEKN
jgi:hypothetical protein